MDTNAPTDTADHHEKAAKSHHAAAEQQKRGNYAMAAKHADGAQGHSSTPHHAGAMEPAMPAKPFVLTSSDNDLRFYEERARQEKAAVEASTCRKAASAHRLLAIEYEAHACELRERRRQARVVHLEVLPCCNDARQ